MAFGPAGFDKKDLPFHGVLITALQDAG